MSLQTLHYITNGCHGNAQTKGHCNSAILQELEMCILTKVNKLVLLNSTMKTLVVMVFLTSHSSLHTIE